MLVPIPSLNGEPSGIVQLVNRQLAPRFDDADLAVAEAFAACCGVVLSQQQARDEAARGPALRTGASKTK